jgi:nucleoside-diphosphate-sugar epimerase
MLADLDLLLTAVFCTADDLLPEKLTYVDNVLDGTTLALTTPGVAGQLYNVATGHGVTLNELYRLLSDLVGADIEPIYEEARPGEVRHSQADVSRAEAELGFRPAVSIEEGLRRTVEWLERAAGVASE